MGALDSILDFIIPILVYAFLIYLIYRIEIVKKGVNKLKEMWSNRKTNVNAPTSLNSINYE